MNLYRITFYSSFGSSFSTKIQGNTIDEAMENLENHTSVNAKNYVFYDCDQPNAKSIVLNRDSVFYTEFELVGCEKNGEKFTFVQLAQLSNKHLCKVINHVKNDTILAKALRKADANVGVKFFDSMENEMKVSVIVLDEKLGDISDSEVQSSQDYIINIALQLLSEGEISL